MMNLTYTRIYPNYSEELSSQINSVIGEKLQHQNWIEKNMQISKEILI